MTELLDAHRQWATRPYDQRYTSLYDMLEAATLCRNNSEEITVKIDDIKLIGAKDDSNTLTLAPTKKGSVPFGEFTNFSFGQVAQLGDAQPTAMYKRPAPMVADWINYGLKSRAIDIRDRARAKASAADVDLATGDIKDTVKILTRRHFNGAEDNTQELAAITGPGYGRVWDVDLIKRLTKIAGDGVSGDWRVPGEFGKAVTVTKDNTTLYRSDRDLFVFLANEKDRVPAKRRGDKGLARGFFLWQSEVGGKTIGYKRFLFDYACSNRIVWGASEIKGKTMRHTQSTPDRVIEQMMPQIYALMMEEHEGVEEKVIAHAQTMMLPDPAKFITQHFGPSFVDKFQLCHIREEETAIETLWDVVTAGTAVARAIPYADKRTEVEEKASRLLDLAAKEIR